MRVLILAHGEEITAGWLLDALEEVGADHTMVDLSLGDHVPLYPWDKIVVLGGHMGAYDVAEYPWLDEEKALVANSLAAGRPVLGICLGAQLMADVIGGRAFRSSGTEAGLLEVSPTVAGAADSTLAAITGPVVVWHHDTFELPSDAQLLAFTDDYPHAFRYGTGLGVQFHPEVTPQMWADWVAAVGVDDLLAAGVVPADLAASIASEAERLRHQAVGFFRSWLEE